MAKATIKDVAKRANVSIATVSRVINNSNSVNENTKNVVKLALKELNYNVNAVARSLKTNRSKLVGVLVPDISNTYYNDLFSAFETSLSLKGYSLIICSSNNDIVEEYNKMKMLLERNVDGIIFFPINNDCTHLGPLNIDKIVPIVMVDRSAKGLIVDKVLSNNVFGTYHLTKALIDDGFKSIGFIGGNEHVSNARSRYLGYLKAMEEFNLKVEGKFVIRKGDTIQDGYDGIKNIWENEEHPNAFVLENQMTHVGATIYLKSEKTREEVKEVCFASYDFTRYAPLLTFCHYAMYQPVNEISKKVIELLLKRIDIKNNENPISIIIKPEMKFVRSNYELDN